VLPLPGNGTIETAPSVWVPIFNNAFFYDLDADEDSFQGQDAPLYMANGSFEVFLWVAYSTLKADAWKIVPTISSFHVVHEIDTPGDGDPNDVAPTAFPNLFRRNFGSDEHLALVDSASPERPHSRPVRTLYRKLQVMHAGEWNLFVTSSGISGTANCRSFTARLRGHKFNRTDGLWYCLRGFNDEVDACNIGVIIQGHFGFTRKPLTSGL